MQGSSTQQVPLILQEILSTRKEGGGAFGCRPPLLLLTPAEEETLSMSCCTEAGSKRGTAS